MILFKDDPIRKLKKLVRAIPSLEALNWQTRNQADLERLVEFLKREAPAIEGMTIADAKKHPAVARDPLFASIMSLFSRLNELIEKLEKIAKKKGQFDAEDLKKIFHELETDISIILYESVMLREKGLPELKHQEITGAGEIAKVIAGYDVRFMCDNDLAVFSSDTKVTHEVMKREYFSGRNPIAGMIVSQKKQIEVFESRHTKEEVVKIFNTLSNSILMKPLNNFFIIKGSENIGRFICRHGGMGSPVEMVITTMGKYSPRLLLMEMLNNAKTQKEREEIMQRLREIHEGD